MNGYIFHPKIIIQNKETKKWITPTIEKTLIQIDVHSHFMFITIVTMATMS